MTPDGASLVVRACVFDAYGTLFDFGSAVQRHGQSLGGKAHKVVQTWRSKQLEYAWVGSLRGVHADFWTCTTEALDYALALHGAGPHVRNDLLEAYRALDIYPDAALALGGLRQRGIRTAVLSNGTPRMLREALESADLDGLLETCISIEDVGIYKPAPAAYGLAASRLGVDPRLIGFVSSNPWDVIGALGVGFLPIWVNRDARPDEYGVRSMVYEAPTLTAAAGCFGLAESGAT
jgi:2-haloacid dehalogenase